MKIEFGMDSFAVQARKGAVEVTVDLTKLNADIVAKLALHGLKQKIADSAAGAVAASESDGVDMTADEWAENQMRAVADRLMAGDWGAERGSGTGLTELMRECIRVIRPQLKKAHADDYKAATPAERDAWCVRVIEAQKPEVRADIEAQAQSRIDARKAETDAVAGLGITL